jgi:hypothetical protein
MIYLIDPTIVGNGCKTLCATYSACKPVMIPLYGVPTDTI